MYGGQTRKHTLTWWDLGPPRETEDQMYPVLLEVTHWVLTGERRTATSVGIQGNHAFVGFRS